MTASPAEHDRLLTAAAGECRAGRDLRTSEAGLLVEALIDSAAGLEPRADFLRALRDKGETAAELRAFADALRPRAIHPGIEGSWNGQPILDCCGVGGGGVSMINISTGMIFILAACGVPVMKHGNRGVSKACGSADVLEALGMPLYAGPSELRLSLAKVGMAFVFARHYHPAFAAIAPVRQALAKEGRSSIFNLLGPMLNPVRPRAQVVGVFRREHLPLFYGALGSGAHEAGDTVAMVPSLSSAVSGAGARLIVYGETGDGRSLGEASPWGRNTFAGPAGLDWAEGWEARFAAPSGATLEQLVITSAEESATRLVALLAGREQGIARAMLLINAAVALRLHAFAAGRVITCDEAAAAVEQAVESGAALERLRQWQELGRTTLQHCLRPPS